MLRAIDHRGPDGGGSWREGPVVLGHQELRTSPESVEGTAAGKPEEEGDLVLVADARLDQRDRLVAKFGADGRQSDGRLLLRAYREWGVRCVEHLIGDFAFALWDRSRQTLFCARDHFGVRPFYYAELPGHGLFFGSEIKALLEIPTMPRRLNETRVAN